MAEKKHPLRAHLQAQVKKRKRRREVTDQDSRDYSEALFVLERLLEFPFEKFPAHAYPGHLLRHAHIRWHHVEQVIRFCELLKQPKGSKAGQPVRLLGFQILIIFCILGPEDPDTKLRLARTVVMTIARKNGKSALVAMIYLAMMSLDCFHMKAQDIHVGASDREQAGVLFDLIQKLILLDKNLGLAGTYHIVPSRKTITHQSTYTNLRCLSSESHRAHGLNSAAVLVDEAGSIPDGRAREFYGVLSTAFGSQDEPLLMLFSTQAPVDSHMFSEFVDRAKQNNLAFDDATLCGFLFELAKEDDGTGLVLMEDGKTVDHFAEENWTRSNPALEGLCPDGFRSLADIRSKAKEAKGMPSQENNFRNLQLNQRITAHAPYISQAVWQAVQQPPDEIPEDILEECPCYVALDLSARRDLTARASTWVLDGGRLFSRVRFYTPEEGLAQKAKGDRVPLDTWAAQGFIFPTPGKIIDYTIVAEELRDHAERYPVAAIGYDRWRIEDLKRECVAVGFDPYEADAGDFWFSIGQGFKDMNPCVEALESMVVDRRILIEENPVLTWNASNAVSVQDPTGARKLDKSKSYGRIDGLVALIMSVWMATQGDLDDRAGIGESVYETEDGPGLLVL